MDAKFWNETWQRGEIGFHQDNGHPALPKYGAKLPRGQVFVPLCGKSRDLLWLARNGFTVVGAELSPIACRDFFAENNLTFTLSRRHNFEVYESEMITIWCGDYFHLPSEAVTENHAVFDRAALIALPPEMREKYVSHLKDLLSARSVNILLVTLEYSPGVAKGPPFSVSEAEVRRLYSGFSVELLAKTPDVFLKAKVGKFSEADELWESIYFISKSGSESRN